MNQSTAATASAPTAPVAVGLTLKATSDDGARDVALTAGVRLIGTYGLLRLGRMHLWQIAEATSTKPPAFVALPVPYEEEVEMQARFPDFIRQIETRGALTLEFYSLNDENPDLCLEQQELSAECIVVTPTTVHADGKLILTRDPRNHDDYWTDGEKRNFSDWSVTLTGQ